MSLWQGLFRFPWEQLFIARVSQSEAQSLRDRQGDPHAENVPERSSWRQGERLGRWVGALPLQALDSVSVQGGQIRWPLEVWSLKLGYWPLEEGGGIFTYETWSTHHVKQDAEHTWGMIWSSLTAALWEVLLVLVSQMSNLRLWECHSFYPRSHRQQVALGI